MSICIHVLHQPRRFGRGFVFTTTLIFYAFNYADLVRRLNADNQKQLDGKVVGGLFVRCDHQ